MWAVCLCWQHIGVSGDLLFRYQPRFSMTSRCQKRILEAPTIFSPISLAFRQCVLQFEMGKYGVEYQEKGTRDIEPCLSLGQVSN